MQNLRVLHIVKWYPNQEDPQNGIFIKKHIDAASPDAPVIGFVNEHFPPHKEGNRTIYGAARMGVAAKIAAFYAALAEHKPDLIHFHCYAKDLVPMLWIGRSRGLKTLHSEHWSGLLPNNEGSIRGMERTLMRWYFHRINRVLAVSEPLAIGIKSVAPKSKVQTIANIVSDVPESEPQPFASTSFCCVGDVVFDIKRQDQILEVFKQIPRMRCELHFYGGGPDLERLQALAKHTTNVHVHGRITNDQVLEILPAHHAHILFSKYETFGITTLEARKAGLWAITGPDFGSASYVDDYTRFASDSSSLLSAMQEILEERAAPKNNYPELRSSTIGSEIIGVYQGLKS